MTLLEYLALDLFRVLCCTWLVFFSIKMLTKHTDFGQNKKMNQEKDNRIFKTEEDSFESQEDILSMFGTKKPKIETSFGDGRIGDVHEHEKKS